MYSSKGCLKDKKYTPKHYLTGCVTNGNSVSPAPQLPIKLHPGQVSRSLKLKNHVQRWCFTEVKWGEGSIFIGRAILHKEKIVLSEQAGHKVLSKRTFPKIDALSFLFPSLILWTSLLKMCSAVDEQEQLLVFCLSEKDRNVFLKVLTAFILRRISLHTRSPRRKGSLQPCPELALGFHVHYFNQIL